jgi:hypothetical protein
VIEAGDATTNLRDGCCDAIFLRDVYHHLTHPAEIDQSILSALRPGGLLASIDFPPKWYLRPWTPKGVPANRGGHGIPQTVLASELTTVSFQTRPRDQQMEWRRELLRSGAEGPLSFQAPASALTDD